MNCLIILLLLACGGCRNGQSCGCGNMRSGNACCQRDDDRDNDCPCMGEGRGGSVRCPGNNEEHEHHEHHDHHDHDRRQGGPAAWNSFPSISGGESCGCDAE